MTPTTFKEQNQSLGHGGNPNTGDMMVCICFDPDGIPMRISKWKLSPEELERVKETGEIWLGTMGHGAPPPIMGVGIDPFEHLGFKPHPKMKPIGAG